MCHFLDLHLTSNSSHFAKFPFGLLNRSEIFRFRYLKCFLRVMKLLNWSLTKSKTTNSFSSQVYFGLLLQEPKVLIIRVVFRVWK